MNSKKIVVSTLALAMGAALVGSISGSVAWYQYSTRVTTAISGTSTGSSRNLQIASSELADLVDPAANGWGYNIAPAAHTSMNPVTPVFNDSGVATGDFKRQPVYQYFTTGWKDADNDDVISYDMYLQAVENGSRVALPVYLTGYQISLTQNSNAVDNVIKDALRVQITPITWNAEANEGNGAFVDGDPILLSNKGGATTIAGKLDLNNNGLLDKDGFYADDSTGVEKEYVINENVTSYDSVTFDSIKAGDADAYNFTNKSAQVGENTVDHTIITTQTNHVVKLSIKVWLEGWQWEAKTKHIAANTSLVGTAAEPHYSDAACTQLISEGTAGDNGQDVYVKSCLWANSSINTSFNLDLRFACEAQQ